MASERIYGIDLGTTYSCISYVDEHGKPVVLPNSEGQLTTPSVVYFENSENIVVGKTAKDVAELYPEQVISTVKRVIGEPEWETEQYDVIYQPQDVSSFILRKLIADAQNVTGDTITDIVITCPAYFGVTQKEATRQAGELAGLNVRYVIPEPTAAAIAYGIDQSTNQVVLVFDLGGGTFDITVIDVKADAITVICTGGDHDLGGKNWDETLAEWYAAQFGQETGIASEDLTSDPETWQELLNSAEEAKISLSSKTSHAERIRYGAKRVVAQLTREEFDELTGHLRERTISLTEEVLAIAQEKGYGHIDKCLLVGGSTYMPQIRAAVEAKFPFEIKQFDPNQAVAKGAALFGFKFQLDDQIKIEIAKQTGEDFSKINIEDASQSIREKAEQKVAHNHQLTLPAIRNLTQKAIRNVTAKSFGVVVVNDQSQAGVTNLIVIDQELPISISREFGTAAEGQEGVDIRCMENIKRVGPEGDLLELDTSTEIGSAKLTFTKPLPRGSRVRVTFTLSEDGLLSVYGEDFTTGQETKAEIRTAAILTNDEFEKNKIRNMILSVS